jgi:hypothetical protein
MMEIEDAVRRMSRSGTHRDPRWSTTVKAIDEAIGQARMTWLAGLLVALLRAHPPTELMRHGFEVALRRLATMPCDASRVALVREAAVRGRAWGEVRYELAEVAEWLAIGQPVARLLEVFETADATDELAACLLQETALRYDATAAAGFAERLSAAGHPLATLPLHRTPAENEHQLPRYGEPPQPRFDTPGDGAPPAPGPDAIDVTATRLNWPGAGGALSAHRNWLADDGYGAEAGLFLLNRPLTPADFGASLLRVLGADSVGRTPTSARRVTTTDVLRKLFTGAAGGGPYGGRRFGAYGRLASWESLAALVGVPDGDPATIESAAGRCAWLFATSDWHLQVHPALDVGIAVLRPDHRQVAILSVTTSD